MPVDAMLAPGAEVSGVFGVLEIHSKTVEFIYSVREKRHSRDSPFKMGHNSTNRNSADRLQYAIHNTPRGISYVFGNIDIYRRNW